MRGTMSGTARDSGHGPVRDAVQYPCEDRMRHAMQLAARPTMTDSFRLAFDGALRRAFRGALKRVMSDERKAMSEARAKRGLYLRRALCDGDTSAMRFDASQTQAGLDSAFARLEHICHMLVMAQRIGALPDVASTLPEPATRARLLGDVKQPVETYERRTGG
jgi:hypothetical protein